MSESLETVSSDPVFRSSKRQRVFRRRDLDASDGDDDADPSAEKKNVSSPGQRAAEEDGEHAAEAVEGGSDQLSVADLLRLRKFGRARRGGIEFSNPQSIGSDPGNNKSYASQDLITTAQEDKQNASEAAQRRFAPQTGSVAESNNQHMMAYIDAEMARLRAGNQSSAQDFAPDPSDPLYQSDGTRISLPQRQPAALGQIHEIDLGPDSALRNIAKTEAATRRLQDGLPLEEIAAGKVRLGRDGKPRKPRKRRGSDDLKRDEIVEAVLKESRIGIYDSSNNLDQPHGQGSANEEEMDRAADDAIADQFQRDFLDAVQSRNRSRRQRAAPTQQGKAKVDTKSRGPKLGGSRSARAAMHAMEKDKGKQGRP